MTLNRLLITSVITGTAPSATSPTSTAPPSPGSQPETPDNPGRVHWAGHSVEMLLRVYAKCFDGTEQAS
ncbi:MAG: hypothetical protein HZY75_03100 [Nocardioidaceae bacterium]|nr:MAG: hypothetical protein HZY75_03100 [Nocardioidaceae bacterium]